MRGNHRCVDGGRHHRRMALVPLGAVAIVALLAGPVGADGENANSTALQATGLTPVNTAAVSECPGNPGPNTVLDASVPDLSLVTGTLSAECDDAGGENSASSSVEDASFTPFDPGLDLDLIQSECSSTANGASGSTTLIDVNGNPIVPDEVRDGLQQLLDQFPGAIATVVVNEQIPNDGGFFTVNAIHVNVLPETGGEIDVIIAQSRCALVGGVIPEVPLALLLPLSALGLFGAAYLVLRRRTGVAVA